MKYNAHGQEMEIEAIFSTLLREYLLSPVLLLQFIFFYVFLCFRAVSRQRGEYRVSSSKQQEEMQAAFVLNKNMYNVVVWF